MAFTEFEKVELENAGLLECYDEHQTLWAEMAELAYDQAVDSVTSEPDPDDVVDYLLPALRIKQEFRQCKSEAGGALGAQKWYRYFADYILKKSWPQIIQKKKGGGANGTNGDTQDG